MIAFEFIFSEHFVVEMFRRSRRGRKLTWFAVFTKIVLAGLLTALIALLVTLKVYLATLAILPFLLLLAFARRIDEWLIARRFRKSPYYDDRLRILLSAEGIAAQGQKSSSQASWAVFTAARRLDDGFLLYQGPGLMNWLPTRAIVLGSAQEAEELIRANVRDFQPA